jgi:hypothetical protein
VWPPDRLLKPPDQLIRHTGGVRKIVSLYTEFDFDSHHHMVAYAARQALSKANIAQERVFVEQRDYSARRSIAGKTADKTYFRRIQIQIHLSLISPSA